MIATNSISSGQIAADVTLRDKTLVQAQTQVDQLAASMSSALSDKTTAGTAAPAALSPKAGFDLDVSNVLPGNTINLTYTDGATNTQHNVTIVRVDDPTALPLVECRRKSQQSGDRRQLLGRHGLGRFAVEHRARRRQPAVLQSVRIDVARCRHRHRVGDRQRGLGHDDGFVACERQPAAAAVHRRNFALHRRDHRHRLAA